MINFGDKKNKNMYFSANFIWTQGKILAKLVYSHFFSQL